MSRIALEPAWVLHTRPWRDTSMMLEVLSRDHGRVGLIARGVRGPRARWRGVLQTFQPLVLSWSGRGELATVSGCEADGPSITLRDEALMSAWYLHEVLLRLLQRNDPHPPLFAVYGTALAGLASGNPSALRVFEKRLLDELGWGPVYDHASDDGTPVTTERSYGFSPDRGVLAQGKGDMEVRGAVLLALAHEQFPDAHTLNEARRVLQLAIEPHLGGRPLESRALLRQWRARRSQSV